MPKGDDAKHWREAIALATRLGLVAPDVAERILVSANLRVGTSGFVTFEQSAGGVFDCCGMRYYHASVFKRAEDALRPGGSTTRSVPVAPFHASA